MNVYLYLLKMKKNYVKIQAMSLESWTLSDSYLWLKIQNHKINE